MLMYSPCTVTREGMRHKWKSTRSPPLADKPDAPSSTPSTANCDVSNAEAKQPKLPHF